MASSENQGLQIALIIFVMLTIILSVTTFIFFRQYEEADARATTAAADATTAKTAQTTMQNDLNTAKGYIGVDAAASMDAVKTKYTEDMANFATTVPKDQQTYSASLAAISKTFGETSEQLVTAREDIKKLEAVRDELTANTASQVKIASETATKASDDLKGEMAKFDAGRAEQKKTADELAANIQATKKAAEDEVAKKQKDLDAMLARVNDLLTKLGIRNAEFNKVTHTEFETADGQVLRISPNTRTVFIDVGTADNLTKQVSFSVHGQDKSGTVFKKPKGQLEVLRIVGDHLAEAKIVDDQITDPIVPGDKIYTPLWQPGRQERFAIMGKIDLDKDGNDDRQVIRDLIALNGGVIDAEWDLQGNQSGKVTTQTTYLIMGDSTDALGKAIKDAEEAGVKKIKVNDFVDLVGFRNPSDVLRFGRGGNAANANPRTIDGGRAVSTGSVSESFKKRRPPITKGDSAYDPAAAPAAKSSAPTSK